MTFVSQAWLEAISYPELESVGAPDRTDTEMEENGPAALFGGLQIETNDALTTVDLSSLREVGGNLEIYENPSLSALDLSVLGYVGGNLDVYQNDTLCQADIEDMVQYVYVVGNVYVRDNTGECY